MALVTLPRFVGWGQVSRRVAVVGGIALASIVLGTLVSVSHAAALVALSAGPAVLLMVAVRKRPDLGLLALAIILPFQNLILAQLLLLHVPLQVLSNVALWKDLVAITLVAITLIWGRGLSHTVDRLIVVYLLLIAVYIVVPLGPALNIKIIAARLDGFFLLVFLAARNLPLLLSAFRRVEVAVITGGSLIAVGAFVDHFLPDRWQSFVQSSGLIIYRSAYFGYQSSVVVSRGMVAGKPFLRAGSIFLTPVDLAFFLTIPVALAISHVATRWRSWYAIAGLLCCGGLLLSLTRSAILCVPVMLAIAFVIGRRKGSIGLGVLVGAAALLPIAGGVALTSQLGSALNTSDPETSFKIGALAQSINVMLVAPLGHGLATAGTVGQRFNVSHVIDNESWYFQLATELGVVGMALYSAIAIGVIGALWRRAREGFRPALAALVGFVALSLGGLFLQSFEDIAVAWPIWMLAGLALGLAEREAKLASASMPVPSVAAVRGSVIRLPRRTAGLPVLP